MQGLVTTLKKIRTYSELVKIDSFKERFDYLRIGGKVGDVTFGYDRYLNQLLYTSKRWRKLRDEILIRDEGCDMAHPDWVIPGKIIVHHMNPIELEDLEEGNEEVFDPEYLVCVSATTHIAIHFSDDKLLPQEYVPRHSGDTCPWVR